MEMAGGEEVVGVRIFWVGWGLMQHHDWESCRRSAAVTLCSLVSGGLEGNVTRCVGSGEGGTELLHVVVSGPGLGYLGQGRVCGI